jgi:hypothetical protein
VALMMGVSVLVVVLFRRARTTFRRLRARAGTRRSEIPP